MAKKKVQKQEENNAQAAAAAVAQKEQFEQMASLKALNNLLVRETVERREQIDNLQRSIQSLESQIASSAANNQSLEAEKSLFEDRMLEADVEREINLLALSSQLRQEETFLAMTQKLKSAEKERDELIHQIAGFDEIAEDWAKKETRLKEMGEEADQVFRKMGLLQEDLNVKKEEADGLRLMVKELQMSNEATREEMESLRLENDRERKEKIETARRFELATNDRDSIQRTLHELSERYEDLKREMRDAVKEKDKIEKARNELDVEITRLRDEVNLLAADLRSSRDALDNVCLERDAVQNDLNLQKEEERRTIESLLTEKASLERRLAESSQLIGDLNRKMEEMAKEKDEVELSQAEKMAAITELQNNISTLENSCRYLSETNSHLLDNLNNQKSLFDSVLQERDAAQELLNQLKEEKTGLQSKVFELEKNNEVAREELKRVLLELDGLVKQREEMEGSLRVLMEEKEELLQRSDELMRKLRGTIEERDNIERVRTEQESQIMQLEKEVGRLGTTLSELEESIKEYKERNDQLQADIDRILCDKDDVLADLKKEKKETDGLRLTVMEMENSAKEKQRELVRQRVEMDSLVEEMKEKERCFELLKNAKDSIESSLAESQEGLKKLQVKTEVAEMVSQAALSMLKRTAKMMNGLEVEDKDLEVEDGFDGKEINDEPVQAFVMELEAIKKAYRSFLREAEDMKRELSSLHMSVAKSKKRNLWTLLSSVTTILAAVSFAFVAKGH